MSPGSHQVDDLNFSFSLSGKIGPLFSASAWDALAGDQECLRMLLVVLLQRTMMSVARQGGST